MQSTATTVDEYIDSLPEERKAAVTKLRKTIKANLPKGFQEVMSYRMIGFVVPHSIYAKGYHCDPKLPLPFINIGSLKNYIPIHHMGVYANKNLLDWFVAEYKKYHQNLIWVKAEYDLKAWRNPFWVDSRTCKKNRCTAMDKYNGR